MKKSHIALIVILLVIVCALAFMFRNQTSPVQPTYNVGTEPTAKTIPPIDNPCVLPACNPNAKL